MGDPVSVDEAKRVIRTEMRALRRALPDQEALSERLWRHVETLDAVRSAEVVMVFDSIVGEPATAPVVERLRARGAQVVVPEDEPRPESVDVVVVPGVAFTRDGRRLGQGGGWYDRFLIGTRDECVTIGVCFGVQIVDDLPTEQHDVRLQLVVTEDGPLPR